MKRFVNILLLLFSIITASAQTSFQAIAPRNVVVGKTFYVTYRLTNGEGSSLNAPAVAGCKLLSPRPGVSTTQSMQIINGARSSSTTVDYSYTYRAEKDGTFTIPEATIVSDGKTYRTSPVSFKILPADKNAQTSADPYDDFFESKPADNITKDDIFVRVILNKNHAYEGEAIECTLKLYTRYERINSFMAVTPPNFDGFLIDEVPVQSQLNELEHYKGQNYVTAILKRCIIFPQKSGKLTISSGKYDLSVVQIERVSNGFFVSGRPVEKKVTLQPYSQTVEITALPHPQPAGFSGAVGQFSIQSKLSADNPRTGQAVALSYTISGTGNIKYIPELKPVIPSEFEQYSPQTTDNSHVSGSTLSGSVTTEYTLVPQSIGDFKIPALDFVYFDPSKRQYVTLQAPGYSLSVAKGAGSTTSVDQQDITAKNTDILHIRPVEDKLSFRHTPIARVWWYWMLYGVLCIGAFVAIAVVRRRERLNADATGRRISKANKVVRKRLRMAQLHLKAHRSEAFYQSILQAIWGYLSDKLNIPASQLNRDNIAQTLADRGVSEALTDDTIAILDECEMARYTPEASSDSSLEHLYRKAAQTISMLEKSSISRK